MEEETNTISVVAQLEYDRIKAKREERNKRKADRRIRLDKKKLKARQKALCAQKDAILQAHLGRQADLRNLKAAHDAARPEKIVAVKA